MNIYVNKKGLPNDSPFKLKPITMKKTNKPCKDNQKLTESKKKVKKLDMS